MIFFAGIAALVVGILLLPDEVVKAHALSVVLICIGSGLIALSYDDKRGEE